MRQVNAELVGVCSEFGRLLDEPLLALFQEIKVATLPESPGIASCHFPTESHAPEHGQDFDAKFSGEIHEAEEVIFGPFLDLIG